MYWKKENLSGKSKSLSGEGTLFLGEGRYFGEKDKLCREKTKIFKVARSVEMYIAKRRVLKKVASFSGMSLATHRFSLSDQKPLISKKQQLKIN